MKETNNKPFPRQRERKVRQPREREQQPRQESPSFLKTVGQHIWTKVRHVDLWLLVPFIVLLFFGALMVYSASVWWSIVQYDNAPNHFYIRQLLFVAAGIMLFIITMFVKRMWYTHWFVVSAFAVLSIGMLIYVRLMGWGDGVGAKSWFSVGPINVQPAEIAKLSIIVVMTTMLSKFLTRSAADNLSVKQYVLLFSYPLICIALVASQPDLGAVVVMLTLMMAIFIVSGISVRRYMRMLSVIAVATGIAGVIGVLTGYINGNRLGRLKAWLNPFDYETVEGYQVIQGYVAIGSGGLNGVGLGHSAQKLGYLPEPHTDFIMAVISEELGIWGVLIVVGLLYMIVCRALVIALTTNNMRTRFFAAGIGTWIGIQTFVNLGGMLGFIPLTGVTLPFISYGGTSTVLLSLSMGILMNLSIHEKMNKRTKRKGDVPS